MPKISNRFQYTSCFYRSISLLLIGSLFVLFSQFILFSKNSQVLAGTYYNKNNIISDDEFTDYNAMSEEEIRLFLLDPYPDDQSRAGGTLSALSNFIDIVDSQSKDAAGIIYDACLRYRINPKVILATLEKEESLITMIDDPTDDSGADVYDLHLGVAMGYGMTSRSYNQRTVKEGEPLGHWSKVDEQGYLHNYWTGYSKTYSPGYYNNNHWVDTWGFAKQVDYAAWQFRYYMDNPQGIARYGWKVNQSHQVDDGNVTPANVATACLYIYTPNIGGNYLFWDIYNNWFTWRSLSKRLSGPNRYKTSTAVSREMFASKTSSVVLVTGLDFADGLSGTSLAAKTSGSLLFAKKDSLVQTTENEIRRLNPDKVYILGGTSVVKDSIKNEILSLGYQVERIAGLNRYDTAVKVAKIVYPDSTSINTIFIASGQDFPDGLSSAPASYKNNAPLLLTEKDGIPRATEDYLKTLPNLSTIYIIGGWQVISDSVSADLTGFTSNVIRIAGVNRFDTTVQIAKTFYTNPTQLVLVSGKDFPDALSGGPLAINKNAPLILTRPSSFPSECKTYIQEYSTIGADTIYILGGETVISDGVKREVEKVVAAL